MRLDELALLHSPLPLLTFSRRILHLQGPKHLMSQVMSPYSYHRTWSLYPNGYVFASILRFDWWVTEYIYLPRYWLRDWGNRSLPNNTLVPIYLDNQSYHKQTPILHCPSLHHVGKFFIYGYYMHSRIQSRIKEITTWSSSPFPHFRWNH
jgi:hypothetical protein